MPHTARAENFLEAELVFFKLRFYIVKKQFLSDVAKNLLQHFWAAQTHINQPKIL